MHPSTEDLLAVRDGEPLDAIAKSAIESSLAHGREVERLRRVQNALRALPPLAPPRDALAQVLEVRETSAERSGRWLRVAVGAGVAAGMATAVALYFGLAGSPRSPLSAPGVDSEEAATLPSAEGPSAYGALVEQSARLDRLLAELPSQRSVMTGATASTIAGLEDRIAFVDEQLAYSAAGRVPVPQRAALWSDRVELMNALVSVRYAEAQANGL